MDEISKRFKSSVLANPPSGRFLSRRVGSLEMDVKPAVRTWHYDEMRT